MELCHNAGDQLQLLAHVDGTGLGNRDSAKILLKLYYTDGTFTKILLPLDSTINYSTAVDSGIFVAAKNWNKIKVFVKGKVQTGPASTLFVDDMALDLFE